MENFLTDTTLDQHPSWYFPDNGIYSSKHPKIPLPEDPFIDIVSFIFSKPHSGNIALIDSLTGDNIPYSDLYRLVKSVASGLHQMGISHGDVILLVIPNSIYFPIIFLGILSIGAIVSPMNPLSSSSEVKKQAHDCHAKFAFATTKNAQLFNSLGVKKITVPETLDHANFLDFYKLFSSDPNLAPKVIVNQEDTGAIMYSSGTTVVVRRFDGDEMVRDIERYKVTHFHTVPPLVMALTEKAKRVGRERLRSLRQVSSGAAPLSKKCIDEFVQALPHVDFIQGYAMTESTAIATRGFNTKEFRNYTLVGLLSPNTEAKVIDIVTGSYMPPRKKGELLLRGPGTMKGYLNNPKATAQAIDRDGWLHTDDIVYFDEYGYLYICDRLKEMIKYKGFQIAPAELESLMISHPDVVDVAIVAQKDEEAGEIPVAFVVKRKGSHLSEAALSDYVAKQVSPYKRVRKVVFTKSIPKSAAGKILRKELKTLVSGL